ncbi:MAG: hypothetical protein KR126chlam5_00475 [Candidatus Anoxychlamydiales bacterium]|nr:hypothetical protein [Candidatus Anoxychlamydiales bacterium]NGX52180.1 hypothetical protein [Candidatus Anoxychlamydiales bacterium]
MFSAAFDSLRSSLPSFTTLPNFDFSSFKPADELPYIDDFENTEDDKIVKKREILEKLLDNLSIEDFPTFLLSAFDNIRLGKEANSIHPFNTFEFFLSPDRIERTKKIYHKTGVLFLFETFKKESIKGFSCFLKERHERDELLPHLDNFCEKTKKDKTLLKSLIDAGDFDKFAEEVLVNF